MSEESTPFIERDPDQSNVRAGFVAYLIHSPVDVFVDYELDEIRLTHGRPHFIATDTPSFEVTYSREPAFPGEPSRVMVRAGNVDERVLNLTWPLPPIPEHDDLQF